MYFFPDLEPVCYSMSSSNCCFFSFFLNCCFLSSTQISQEAGQVVWYSHLFQNIPKCVVIYTAKGFSAVSEAEQDVFLEFSCFFYGLDDVGNLISHSSAFLNPACISGSSRLMVNILLKPSLEDFEHYLASMWCEHNCTVVRTFWAVPFFGIGMETDLSQSCGHCWVFQICWCNECSTLTASSFRIWNSSAEFHHLQ